MKRIYCTAISLMVFCMAFAQERIVSGVVKDSNGEPLIGVAVLLAEGEGVGTVTDLSGHYKFTIPSKTTSVLIYNYVGFKEHQEVVGDRTVINVTLTEDTKILEEAVVVGYGSMRRSDLTGSLTSIKIDDKTASRSATLDQLLEGQAAGMQLISESASPDAGFSIRIRGLSSFSTSTEPLYVIDGVIISGESEAINMSISSDKNTSNTETSTNGLAGISPSDIASIEILKDASATAIYGSQGANGVVLITTKGSDRSIPVIEFGAGVSISQRMKSLDVLSTDEYIQYLEAKNNATALEFLKSMHTGYKGPDDRGTLSVTPVNWQDFVCRTAISQRYNMAISGRPGGFNYRFSLSYNDSYGIIKKTDSQTINARLNVDKKVIKNLQVGVKANISYVNSSLTNGSSAGGRITGGASILRSIVSSRPYSRHDPYDEPEEIVDDELQFGPNKWLKGFNNTSKRYRLIASAFADWKILSWLRFKSQIGGEFRSDNRLQNRSYQISTIGNSTSVVDGMTRRYNWDNLFLFNKKFGAHSISGTLGQSLSHHFYSTTIHQGWFLSQAYASETNINSSLPENSLQSYTETQNSLLSFFARGVYNYGDRYVLTTTVRLDGSSKFMGKNKWAMFPSFAFAWRMTEEPWFNVPVISNAKFRIGWGQVGNQNIANYSTQQTYKSNHYGDHFGALSNYIVGFFPNNIKNENLKWETSEQVNGGIDLSLWSGRLAITLDGYLKDTKDLLQTKTLAASSGYTQVVLNSGRIRNHGYELTVDAVPLKIAGFEWQLNGNISINRNTIIDIGEEGSGAEIYMTPTDKRYVNYFTGTALSANATEPLNMYIEGQPMGLFYGYVVEGVIKSGETAPFLDDKVRGEGHLRYKDINGDGKLTTADRTIIGNPQPDFTYGFGTSLSYRNFELKMSFVGLHGADVYNLNNMNDYYTGGFSNVRRKAFVEAWSPVTQTGSMPALGCLTDTEQIMNSTLYVEDGSYLNWKDLSLSYSFNFKKKVKFIKGLSLIASVKNVMLWTEYSGWTPQSSSTKMARFGVELNAYPTARTYMFDLKFTF